MSFCGGEAKEYERWDANTVTCTQCHAKIKPSQLGYGDAAVRWNKRVVGGEIDVLTQQYTGLTDAFNYESTDGLSPEEQVQELYKCAKALEEGLALADLKSLKSYPTPKEALLDLINWHVSASINSKVNGTQQEIPVEPTT